MLHNPSVEADIEVFLDFMSAKETCGPKRPTGDWRLMTLKDQEDYLVYLRIALEHLDIDPLISEESYLSLLLRYLDLFKHLAHTESALRLALLEKRHMFYRQGDKKLLAMQESLVADLFR